MGSPGGADPCALPDGGDADSDPDPRPVTPLELVRHDTPPHSTVAHSLRALNDEPMSNLTLGQVYFVSDVTPGVSFKLRSTPTAVTTITPNTGGLSGGHHIFAVEGIDLDAAGGAGTHDLVLDILSGLNTDDSFSGIGGAQGVTGAPSGDNTVTATTTGGSGGIVVSNTATASADLTVTTNVTVAGGATLKGTNINVETDSLLFVTSVSDGGIGGGIAIGAGTTNTTGTHHSKVDIGSNAKFTATNDMLISADADSNVNGRSVMGSGGLGAGADASSNVTVNYDVKTEVNGDLTAGNLLTIESRAFANGDAYSEADAAGLGAGANTVSNVTIGSGGEESAVSRTDIEANADLLGNRVVIGAYVDKLRGNAYAETDVTAVGADCDAEATSFLTGLNEVRVLDGAVITGNEKLTVESIYLKTQNYARSDSDLDAAGGDTDSDADVNVNTRAKVEGHNDALLRTAELEVNALQNNFSSDSSARRSGAWIDTGDRSESDGPKNALREIYWESHVIMLGEPNPELEVDASGKIVKMTNVTLATGETLGQTIAGSEINVNDLIYDKLAKVTFYANDLSGAPDGQIWGNDGLFEIQHTWDYVRLIELFGQGPAHEPDRRGRRRRPDRRQGRRDPRAHQHAGQQRLAASGQPVLAGSERDLRVRPGPHLPADRGRDPQPAAGRRSGQRHHPGRPDREPDRLHRHRERARRHPDRPGCGRGTDPHQRAGPGRRHGHHRN